MWETLVNSISLYLLSRELSQIYYLPFSWYIWTSSYIVQDYFSLIYFEFLSLYTLFNHLWIIFNTVYLQCNLNESKYNKYIISSSALLFALFLIFLGLITTHKDQRIPCWFGIHIIFWNNLFLSFSIFHCQNMYLVLNMCKDLCWKCVYLAQWETRR